MTTNEHEVIEVLIPRDLSTLIPRFLANRQADLDRAHGAFEGLNWDTLGDIGHRLYGSAASYGFAGLADIGRRMESAAELCDETGMLGALDAWRHYLDCVCVVYRDDQ